MKIKQIKQILNDDFDDCMEYFSQEEFIDYLKSKVHSDWSIQDNISVYEIAFINHFHLIEYSDHLTYCKKLKTIKNKNRLQGIKKAEAQIKSLYFGNEDIYIKEPKSSINYKENLESEITGMLKLNDILIDTSKEVLNSNGRLYVNKHMMLNDIGEKFKNKLLRSSAITHILEIYDIRHYLDLNFWIPHLKTKYKDIKFIDHKHNTRDSRLGKHDGLNQVVVESTSDLPNYVTPNTLPSPEEVIYKPLRNEIKSILINNGTKEKNAKEIAGIIINTYKKLLNF